MRTLYFSSYISSCTLLVTMQILVVVLYLEYYSYSYRRLVSSYSSEWRAFVRTGRGPYDICRHSVVTIFIVVEVERRPLSYYVVVHRRCDRGDTCMCHRASPKSLSVHFMASARESHLVVLLMVVARRYTHIATIVDPCSPHRSTPS